MWKIKFGFGHDGRRELTEEEKGLLKEVAPPREAYWQKALEWCPQYKQAILAVGHNPMPVMLDSETTGPSTRRSTPSAMRTVRLGEHRRVQAEHELMMKYAQYCQQEASLLSDKAYWNGSGWVATRANLVVQLLRSVRANWLKPGDGVMEAAERIAAQPGGSVPPCSAKSIRKFWREWRNHGCLGFPEDMRGRNHRYTILRDAHPVFEDDARMYIEGKLTSKDGKLSVASFAKALNDEIIPRHDGRPSELRDISTFPSKVPFISHTVAWRYMVQLGFKYGALKKGGTFPCYLPTIFCFAIVYCLFLL